MGDKDDQPKDEQELQSSLYHSKPFVTCYGNDLDATLEMVAKAQAAAAAVKASAAADEQK